jgi:hypothetical protein
MIKQKLGNTRTNGISVPFRGWIRNEELWRTRDECIRCRIPFCLERVRNTNRGLTGHDRIHTTLIATGLLVILIVATLAMPQSPAFLEPMGLYTLPDKYRNVPSFSGTPRTNPDLSNLIEIIARPPFRRHVIPGKHFDRRRSLRPSPNQSRAFAAPM